MNRTYQGRLKSLTPGQLRALDGYGVICGKAERTLFAAMSRGEAPGKLKSAFQQRFQITARQFNAISITLKGKVQSLREIQKNRIVELRERIKTLEKKLPKFPEGTRKLGRLRHQLKALEEDKADGTLRLCFGSRKLFGA